MKRVIFYIDCMQMGGANRVIANLANHFSKENWHVILVNDIHPVYGIAEYDVEETVKRVFLDNSDFTGVRKNLNRVFELRKVVKREKPDVVVSFMGPPNIRMLISTIGLRVKKIVSVRNDPYREYGYGLKRIVARSIFGMAHGCVFQTEEAAHYFSYSIRKKSTIIFNPVNEVFFDKSWRKTKNEIAVVGRLQEQKNPLLALSAFSLIAKEFPQYKLVFYGNDELAKPIEEKAVEMGIEKQVKIFGKSSSIEKHLEESSLYLLSSDYEGMPNALMEAMAVGIPVVSTDCPCGGPRTLIVEKEQGILVPCGDADKMANAIRSVLLDEHLQKIMNIEEKKRAEAFRPEVIYKQWADFLN